ncbi:hypothetical protein [Aminobacter carboxidus]|nr:hypothetical protein [Aminobacter carboxidus]
MNGNKISVAIAEDVALVIVAVVYALHNALPAAMMWPHLLQ